MALQEDNGASRGIVTKKSPYPSVSETLERLQEVVRRGIETFGGTGESLVKGVVTRLSAIGLSIKPDGSAREIDISGAIRTNESSISSIEQHGEIESLGVAGGLVAAGGGFEEV